MTNWRAAAALALLLALAVPPPPTDAALDWQRGPMTIDDATWTVTETKVWHGRNRDGVTVEGFGCCGYWRVVTVERPDCKPVTWTSCRKKPIKSVTYDGALVIFDGKHTTRYKP